MAQINIKIDDELKQDVSKIFNEMGLDITTGIKVYLKRVQRDRQIPFELSSDQPFDAHKVAQQYRAGDRQTVNNLNSLFKELNATPHAAGIGGQILDDRPTPNGSNGIGQTILNKR